MSANTLTEIRRAIVLLKEAYNDIQQGMSGRKEALGKLRQAEVHTNTGCNILLKQMTEDGICCTG